jgi:hypothetical protein
LAESGRGFARINADLSKKQVVEFELVFFRFA